jgi:hypothetical protein
MSTLLNRSRLLAAIVGSQLFVGIANAETLLKNDAYRVRLDDDGAVSIWRGDGTPVRFDSRFTVLSSATDPDLQLRWVDLGEKVNVLYNVASWRNAAATTRPTTKPGHVEDGFDPKSDQRLDDGRTSDVFRATPRVDLRGRATATDGRIVWNFEPSTDFELRATIDLPAGSGEPRLVIDFKPLKAGWYSVGYVGAPSVTRDSAHEFWQPMIWTEKRFPNQPYMTEAYRCPLPGTFVTDSAGMTVGVLADPAELPFDPLPTLANSRFGVALRNPAGEAQPTIFAPMPGGFGSKMQAGSELKFTVRLVAMPAPLLDVHEHLARSLFGFADNRQNSLCSLNETIDNTIAFAMGPWARFDESLRGSAYETDVPGAVKNVSPLHPLSISLITDSPEIFAHRARPMAEYAISRERFLFTTNPDVKGQSASSNLTGPGVPATEIASLYEMTGRRTPFLLPMAIATAAKPRVLNLDAELIANSWQSALSLYRATGDKTYLDQAVRGADEYLANRIDRPALDFGDREARGMFFWTSFAPHYAELFELYETTGERRFLDASRIAARRYAQFVWMCPAVPDGELVVNKGGFAPTYRSSPKLKRIEIAEESVPAWRMSERGLTPESSGTCKGHRAILLASHAAWLRRIGAATNDAFLMDIARSAVIGRSRAFPGYHINTARTSAYEKLEFAERPLEELNSTTSLHYNHIWPHIAMLMDYLLSDVHVRTGGQVSFPSHYDEGYAYLQSKVYGDRAGTFYGEKNVWLFMPRGLLRTDGVECNYVAARGNDKLYVVLTNESNAELKLAGQLDLTRLPSLRGTHRASHWRDSKPADAIEVTDGKFGVVIAPRGTIALAIEGVTVTPAMPAESLQASAPWAIDNQDIPLSSGGKAVVFNFGPSRTSFYAYVRDRGDTWGSVTLQYRLPGSADVHDVPDKTFPFEWTVELPEGAAALEYRLNAVAPDGKFTETPWQKLSQRADP